MAEEQPDQPDQQLEEDFLVWKKNSPFLYDLVQHHRLRWPSLTVQWLPEVTLCEEKRSNIHKLVLGTHTSDDMPNYLMIGEVLMPLAAEEVEAKTFEEKERVSGFGCALSRMEITKKIRHEGEVNRARAMPQNSSFIATKAPSPTVYVFDLAQHPPLPTDELCRPQHRCMGHSAEGYGVSWNPHTEGRLLSGADDSLVCLWDLSEAGVEVQPLLTFQGHTAGVEDVDWSKHHAHIFASAGDDKQLLLWDSRAPAAPTTRVTAHSDDVNSVSFNPLNEFLLATGSTDTTVALWDVRSMGAPVHVFEGHVEGIYNLDWAPFDEKILASCSQDRRVIIWDLSRIGEEQDPDDAEDGPPELLFSHGGHSAKVSDFQWHPSEEWGWTAASVSADNILQIWQLSDSIIGEESDEEVDDADLEGEEGEAEGAEGAEEGGANGGAGASGEGEDEEKNPSDPPQKRQKCSD